MTHNDKLILIDYETAKYINAMEKIGYENVSIAIHNVILSDEINPNYIFPEDENSKGFKTYKRLNEKLTLFS